MNSPYPENARSRGRGLPPWLRLLLACLLWFAPQKLAADTWTTLAGPSTGVGYKDGPGATAWLLNPNGVCVDPLSGAIYVAEESNNVVRKIAPDGIVSTFAGKARAFGFVDGTGSVARLGYPRGIAVDSAGNVFLTDRHRIRKITPAGVVTTIAGGEEFGSADGTGTVAQFYDPRAIAVDQSGVLYVADSGNATVRKVTQSGVVTTLAGVAGAAGGTDGAGINARFRNPLGIAVDPNGNIFVTSGHAVRKISASGVVSTFAGSHSGSGRTDGNGIVARFTAPWGLAVDGAGNLYVADNDNGTLRKISASGDVTTLAGTAGRFGFKAGTPGTALFGDLRGVAVDGAGNIVVADGDNAAIWKVSPSGVMTSLTGTGLIGVEDGLGSLARFRNATAITVDPSGNVYVADKLNYTIRKITPGGLVSTICGTPQVGSGFSDGPAATTKISTVDGIVWAPDGSLYFAQSYQKIIRKITPSGQLVTVAGTPNLAGTSDGTGSGATFQNPSRMAADSSGNVYVVDDGSVVRRITPAGLVTTIAGKYGVVQNVDGPASTALLDIAGGMAADSSGNVYLACRDSIRKITPAGMVSTVAPVYEASGGLAFDAGGYLYIGRGDSGSTVRKLTPAGVLSTIAGKVRELRDGSGSEVRFVQPYAIAIGPGNRLYVADPVARNIRVGQIEAGPVQITGQPSNVAVKPGSPVQFSVATTGEEIIAYQWRKGGVNITGATEAVLSLSSAQLADAGKYDVVVKNSLNTVTSNAATLTVSDILPVAPFIAAQPSAVRVTSGSSASFSVTATGTAPLSYQWRKGGAPVTGGTASVLVFAATEETDAGSYDVAVSNLAGTFVSDAATLTVDPLVRVRPTITSEPLSQTVYPGISATFRVKATASPLPLYQWRKGGVAITGATGPEFTLSAVQASDAGAYDVLVANTEGSVTSAAAVLSLLSVTPPVVGLWSTYAGAPGGVGAINATGSDARFAYLQGVAIDSAGTLYVADTANHAIRKITAAGVVTTLAGSLGTSGFVNGTGSAARFTSPQGVAVVAGTVYVSDTGTHTIRKITPAGVVTTFAGSMLVPGSNNGTGTSAKFNKPWRLAADASGNLLVADYLNHAIRKVTPEGVVTTLTGGPAYIGSADGTLSTARFNRPSDIALDAAGNAYVLDSGNKTVRKIGTDGNVTLLAGSAGYSGSTDATGAAARFDTPIAIAADAAGTVYVADKNRLRKITAAGVVTTLAGSATAGFAEGSGSAAQFVAPQGLVADAAGNLFVGDTGNSILRKVVLSSGTVGTFAGAGASGALDGQSAEARFHSPRGVAADALGNVYVADSANHTIRKIDVTGAVTTFAGVLGAAGFQDGTGAAARFNAPQGLIVDLFGNVLVADTGNHAIRGISPTGAVTTLAGLGGTAGSLDGVGSAARFWSPRSVAQDLSGNIYVADGQNFTIRKILPSGLVITLAGTVGNASHLDGTGTAARFESPMALVVDANGVVSVADGPTIRKITPTGVVTTLAGASGFPGSTDGKGAAAAFAAPQSLAQDAAGNLYVADTFNHTIRKVDPSGAVTTYAGAAGQPGSSDGTATEVRFAFPAGITLDGSGNLFVADMDNAKIRLGALGSRPIAVPLPPLSTTAVLGGTATFTVLATGPGPFNYQWRRAGVNIPGATGATYSVSGVQSSDAGLYDVVVGNTSGGVASAPAALAVSLVPLEPVTLPSQPASQTVAVGNTVVFQVGAVGTEPLTYQWRKDGVTLVGATGSSFSLPSVQVLDGGSYDVLVSNPVGSVASAQAKLTVDIGLLPASILIQPTSQKVFPGASATFNVLAAGTPPLGYQWRKAGVSIAGATAAGYTIDSVQPADLAVYSVLVTGTYGQPVASADVPLSFDLTPPAGGIWSVLAGAAGGAGSLDATGAAAQFNYPRGLTMDGGSNLYVADTQNHTIRKITPAGVVTTLAGIAGSRGGENGLPLQSRFRAPQGIAIDAGSNLYVADTGNHVIRKISASGVLSTFAGNLGTPGSLNGTGIAARFNQPTRVAVDAAGNLFVTDTGNHTIRKITSAGVVSTFAGAPGLVGSTDEVASNARFNSPSDLAFDANGFLYVADTGNKTIRKITSGGTVTTPAGRAGFYGTDDGTGDAARFATPTALTSDAGGNLWVLDGNRLRAVTSSGVVTTPAGSFLPGAKDGPGNGAEFFNPLAVCIAPTGTLYIADTGNSVIRVVGPGSVVGTFAGTSSSGDLDGTATDARFHSPRGAAMDAAGNVYIADAGNHTIRKVTLSGVVTTLAGTGAPGSLDGRGTDAQFNAPQAVAVDAAGNVYVADTGNHVLRVISSEGLVTTLAGIAGYKGSADGTGNNARFSQPRGVALDAAGNIYVSDAGNFTVRKVTPSGVVSTLAGAAGVSGSADGTGAAARFSGPGAIVLESSGNLLLTDGNAVRRLSPGGVLSTVAGSPAAAGALDGATSFASFASFSAPQGLAVDNTATIFVADTFNHTIRKISTDGTVSTLAGAAGATGSADGTGALVRFAYPSGLCVDALGNLVVTDLDNSKVRLGLLRDTPLRILSQPTDSTVFAGDSLTLSVTASGVGPLSYQWRKDGVNLTGATSPEYTIASVQAGDVAGYSAVVSNIAGTVTSGTAAVSLSTEVPTPVRLTFPPTSLVVGAGYAAVFAVVAEGSAPLRYQWRRNGTNIIGATSATYTIRAAAPADAGSYDVLVRNSISSVPSDPVTLTVNDVGNAPPSIITQPVGVTRYPGIPAVFSVGVTGAPPLRFQWRKDGVALAGGTFSTLTVAAALASDKGEYDVIVSNGLETSPVISSKATLNFTNSPPASGMWATLAGAPGGPGATDGGSGDALFSSPQGVALDAAGNAYLADTRNHTIRKISPAGETTTFAGTAGVTGVLNGLGTLARFNSPQSVAVDAAGNVYVADTGNHLIRKITPAGLVTTLAGFPTYVGKADGQGSAARFNFPVALVSDSTGNLYVTDRENHAIRLVSTDGFVTTLAGYAGNPGFADGSGLAARFNRPGGIALRSLGGGAYELFIADTGNKILRKMTATGDVSTVAGAAGLTTASESLLPVAAADARFGNPTGIACSAGSKVYIADGNRIRVLDLADGSVAQYSGSLGAGNDDSSLEASLFNGPKGLAVTAAGEILVADSGNSTLRRINPVTGSVETFAGTASAGSNDGVASAAKFRTPGAAVLDSAGNLYIADAGNHTIRKVTISGVVTTLAGAPGQPGFTDGPGADARFSTPRGLALDAAGNLFVADSGNHVIRVISPAGYVSTFAGSAGLPGSLDGTREAARFSMPRGLAFDAQGNLYVADTFNFSIRKITPTGRVVTLAGSPGAAGTANGLGAAARFSSPLALAVDAAGNLYVADLNAIRKVTPAGLVSTFAGDPALSGSLDGQGPAAGFAAPQALAMDPAGNLYVADTSNQLIRKISPSGSVTTVAGSLGWPGSGEGVGTAVRFASPGGIAADALGNLYVVDADSARVRVGILAPTPLRIVSEPADTTTFLNRTTTFQVSATGPAPLTYQWSKDGAVIPAATDPVYRIAPTPLAAAGTYTVTVTNPLGSVTSRNAVLFVDGNVPTPVVITSQPADLSVVLGASGTLSVTATGSSPLSYQWRKNNAPIPGATMPQLVFPAVAPADAASYDVVVTNPDGPALSNAAVLTVTAPNPGAPLIGSQTVAQKVSPGAGAIFSVTAISAGPFTYQWRKDGVDIPGATTADYNLPAVYAADAGLYQVLVSNGSGSSLSTAAALTLNLIPPISGLWSTLAGPLGGPGSLDSTEPANARFNYPRGLARDAAGTLYIADTNNHTIRKISAAGVVSTVAGAPGVPGSANGAAGLARFNAPSGVALDSAGNLFVADTGNHLIRKISTTGVVSTFAGTSNKAGAQDGAAAVARFNGPQSLVVTSSGTLYVADTGSSVIRSITSGGTVTTFAGHASFVGYRDASSGAAQFNKPAGLALDDVGNLYVADTGNKVVRKIAPDASVTTVAGAANYAGTADGAGTLARFTNPVALVSDALGNLLVLDANRVRSVSSVGLVTTLAGNSAAGFAAGAGAAAQFSAPLGIVSDGSGGAYIADTGNSVVRQVASTGEVTPFSGTPSPEAVDSELPNDVRFRAPRGLAQDALGNIYVADSANHAIRMVANSGATTTLAGALGIAGDSDGEASSARFNTPQAVALDAAGNVYVADTGNHVVRVISTAGAVSTLAGTPGVSGRTDGAGFNARFLSPRGIALDTAGNVYVADSGNLTIRKITPAGVVTTLAGAPGASGSLDGAGSSARFTAPVALALNASGNIVVADGSALRAISPFGNVTTLAGVAGVRGAADGTGANALFASPQGVALDAAGNVFVADTYNQTIRKVSSAGAVTTLAGAVGITGSTEGIGSVARFAYPGGILVDPLGNLCVTELDSAKVRIGALMDTSLLIRTQPVSASVMVDGPASFVVTATGTAPFTYRWRKGGVQIAGAVGPTLVLSAAQLGDAGSYDVVVADAKASVTSGTAQLSVYTPAQLEVAINAQPVGANVLEGESVRFSVDASSVLPLAYQWRRDGTPISGATSAALVLSSAALSDAGTYSVVASHAYSSATSAGAVLAVTAKPPVILPLAIQSQPFNRSVTVGNPASFSVTATGPGTLSYQWRKGGTPLSGATGATFSIATAQTGDAGSYDVVVSSSAGGSVTSNGATLTVSPSGPVGPLGAPTVTSQPVGVTSAPGDTVVFNVLASGDAPLRYQWRKNGVPIANANYLSYKILAVSAADVGSYDVVVSNPLGDATSAVATLALPTQTNAAPVITEQPAAVAAYPGVAATFRVGATGFPAPTFQWRKGGAPIAGATAASYTIASAAAGDAGSYDVVVSNTLGSATSAAAALTLQSLPKGAGTWYTLAGNPGGAGDVDGQLRAARYSDLHDLTRDSTGNLYILDDWGLRKISTAGVVSTMSSFLLHPYFIASDKAGNFYVTHNDYAFPGIWVSKVAANGAVSVLSGNKREAGNIDSNASDSRFGELAGVTVTEDGVVYVVDFGNSSIRKIGGDGSVTTFVGGAVGFADGTGAAAKFSRPQGITHDASGNLYVADTNNHRIRKVTPAGVVTTFAGSGSAGLVDGTGAGARFSFPERISADSSGNLYVSDPQRLVIRKITPAGVVTTLAGMSGTMGSSDGQGASAQFGKIDGISADPEGNLYVCDSANRTIRKITLGGLVTTYSGIGGVGSNDGVGTGAKFNGPSALAVDLAGNVYTTDSSTVIRKISPNGVVKTLAGAVGIRASTDGVGADARFSDPDGLAFSANGDLYIADSGNHLIRKMSPGLQVSTVAGSPGQAGVLDGSGAGARFRNPDGVAVDKDGNIYVADTGNQVVRRISPSGAVTTLAGHPGTMSVNGIEIDGTGSAAYFATPTSVAVDGAGFVYVADFWDHAIRKVSPTGVVSTLAGGGRGVFGWKDAVGSAARFIHPSGVAVDQDANVYVSEAGGNKIRKITPAGAVSTIGGYTDNSVKDDATLSFRSPMGVAVDRYGNVFVADTANARIRVAVVKDVAVEITQQPAGVVLPRGGQTSLTVSFTGTGPFSYQWRRNGVLILDATSFSYSIPSMQPADVGVYDVVIANGAGAVTSAQAPLSLSTTTVTPVTFTTQPGNTSVSPGMDVSLSVAAAGTAPLNYQWRKNGADIAGATGSSYTIAAATLVAGGYYDVVVTNLAGSSLSEPAQVTVGGSTGLRAPVISTQPVSLTVGEGNTAEFTVTATGTAPLRYQWRKNGTPIANANYLRYKILSVGTVDTGAYDVVLTNPVGTVTSSAATLTLPTAGNSVPVLTEQPAAVAVYPGVAATFRVGVTGFPAPTFQWRKGGAPIAGATAASYTIPSAAAGDAGSYDVVVSNAQGSATSASAALTLRTLPKGAGEWFTLAGSSGGSGYVDGKGPLARFESLRGIARDNLDNVYVLAGGQIRKITPDGVVSTIVQGGLDADYSGLAVDSKGNFYVATGSGGGTPGAWIAKVSPSGQVTVLAGDPNAKGTADGTGTVARFFKPEGITVLENGDVYVADSFNNNIRKITATGVVTTVAGSSAGPGFVDGTGAAAKFNDPHGITHDAAGDLYVVDSNNHRIRKVTQSGVVTTYAGTGSVGSVDGPALSARFAQPLDITFDALGNAYVSDQNYNTIRKISPAGVVTTQAGTAGKSGSTDGPFSTGLFGQVVAVVADPNGNVYVTDSANYTVRKVSPSGVLSTVAGSGGVGLVDGLGTVARFKYPQRIRADKSGNFFVSDTGNNAIRKVNRAGLVTTITDKLDNPMGLTLDEQGNIYTNDGHAVVKVSPVGVVTPIAGSAGSRGERDGTAASALFWDINGLARTPDGVIFVSNARPGSAGSSTIRKISLDGTVSTFAGTAGVDPGRDITLSDGTGPAAHFSLCTDLIMDSTGNMFMGDLFHHALRKITPQAVVTTVAYGTQYFFQPRGIALDEAGNLLEVDLRNRVAKVTQQGVVTKIAGTGNTGSRDGDSTTVEFNIPQGIALDTDGNMYVVDGANSKIRVGVIKDVPLQIKLQPAATAKVPNSVSTFNVEVAGSAPMLYQWRKDGLPIAGATQAVYSIPSVQSSDVGVYDVVVTNGAGAITSAPAPLSLTTTLIVPVAITAQPRDVVVNLSTALSLSVTATGTAPLSYQWRRDGVEIPSATAQIYTIPAVNLTSGGYYDVVVTNAAGSVLSDPALVEINGMGNVPPSIRTQPASAQAVAGGFTTFTVAVAGSAPLSYQWRKGGTPISGATSAAYTLNGLRAADAGIYDVEVSNRAGSVTSAAAVLTVANPLAIVNQPVPLTVAVGNYAFFSVSASGTAPITYQWRKDGQPLAGATASFYAVSAAQAADAGVYDVVVGNPGNSLTSNAAPLTVQAGGGGQIALLAQPVNTGALAGGAASFSVSASGTAPITYQWRKNGVAITGATGPVYAVGAVQSADVGSYDVVVGNWSGNLTSAKATLGLYTPVNISSQPLPTSVATGTPAAFTVGATGTAPLAYQWRKDGQSIAGATQATYAILAAQAADVGSYDVVITNPAGAALSSAVALGVGARPVLVKGPVGGSVLAGGTFALSVSATGDGLTYQWRKNGLNISGATASVLTLRRAVVSDGGRFEVVVANAYGAVTPAPSAEVAVLVPVTFTKQPVSALLREGASTTLSAQATGSAPLSYQWRRDGAPIPGATQFSYTVANASAANAGAYDVVVSNPAGAVASSVAQVNVSVALGIVRQPVGASVTQGSSVTLSVLAKGSGELKYTWYRSPATGSPLVVGTLSTLSFPSAALAEAGTYSVLVTGNGTPVFSDRVVLTVSATRGIAVYLQPADESLSEGAAVTVRTVVDSATEEMRQTRYTLCALQSGVPVATGVTGMVPESGVVEVPLRQVKVSGAYVVQFNRDYTDGGTATTLTQPFYVTVRGKTEAVGTYEGLLLDANPAGVLADGAVARGWITLSVGRTGSVSGRVQYVEAGSLAGAPSDALRVYQPVSRTFSGALTPSAEDPLKVVANLRLGVGTQAGREELAVVLDQSSDTPLLTATLTDRVSLPSPAVSVSTAAGLRRNLVATGTLSAAYASVVGRYTLSAPAAGSSARDNNAQLLVQVLSSGRALWASRLTGYSGSGSAGLNAPSATLLLAALYEGRSTVGSTLLTTSALLGELRWVQALDGGWDLALSGDRLEQPRSKVAGSRGAGGFVGAYSAPEFAAGTNLTGVRVLDFSGASDCRINSALLGTLFAAGAPGLTFVSADPLAGGSLGFSWNVTVSSTGVVRTAGIAAGGVTPPALSLRLDKTRGEWSGSYVTGGVRRSLIGCVLDQPASRGRGWFESGTTAGRWELRLGQ